MAKILNINFSGGQLGPNAQTDNGFSYTNVTIGGNAKLDFDHSYGRHGGGYGIKIFSDSRGSGTSSNEATSFGRTVIEGYDDSPLAQIANTGLSETTQVVTTHPARVQDGDSWWYSFSFKISGEGANGLFWAKGNHYEPIIWQMQPVGSDSYSGTADSTSAYLFKSPISFAIDNPNRTTFTTISDPHLYLNYLIPGTTGTDVAFLNNSSNYKHKDLGPINFNTWYDVKFQIGWSAFGNGSVQVWTKTENQFAFPDQPLHYEDNIQTLGQASAEATEGYLRIGHDANLAGNTAANNMQNVIQFDTITGGQTETDVDAFAGDLSISGNILFDGGWDQALSVGAMADYTEVLSSGWTGFFAAPLGLPVSSQTTKSGLLVGATNDYLDYSIAVVNDTVSNSPYAARFEVHPGDMDGFMERAEVSGPVLNLPSNSLNYSWSTYFDTSLSNINSPIMFTAMMSNGYPHDAPPVGMYANSGSVYLQVNQYSSQTSQPTVVIPWGISLDSLSGQWTNFAITSTLGTANGSVSLFVNGTAQIMNYPFGTANGSAGYNTYTYTGPTLRPTALLYPTQGIRRAPDAMSTALLWHDNFKVTNGSVNVYGGASDGITSQALGSNVTIPGINGGANTAIPGVSVGANGTINIFSSPSGNFNSSSVGQTLYINGTAHTIVASPVEILYIGGTGYPLVIVPETSYSGGTITSYPLGSPPSSPSQSQILYVNGTAYPVTVTPQAQTLYIGGTAYPISPSSFGTSVIYSGSTVASTTGLTWTVSPTITNQSIYIDEFDDSGDMGFLDIHFPQFSDVAIVAGSTTSFGVVGAGTTTITGGSLTTSSLGITGTVTANVLNAGTINAYLENITTIMGTSSSGSISAPDFYATASTGTSSLFPGYGTFALSTGTTIVTGGTITTGSASFAQTSGTTTIFGGTYQAKNATGTTNIYPGSGTFTGLATAGGLQAGTGSFLGLLTTTGVSGSTAVFTGLATAAGLVGGTGTAGIWGVGTTNITSGTINAGTVTNLNVGSLSINGTAVTPGSAFGSAYLGTAVIGTASIISGTVFNFSSTATSGTTNIYPGSMTLTGLATAAGLQAGTGTAGIWGVGTLNVGSLTIGGTTVAAGSAFGSAYLGTAVIGTASIISGTVFNFSSTATSGTTTIVGGTYQASNSSGITNIYPGSGTFSLTEYQTIQSYAPTAFWQLNEASGNFIDYSGNGYTGTASNLGYGSPGPGVNSIGNAAYFNGSSSQAIANPSGLTNKNTTIVAWFKPGGGNGSAGPVIAVGTDYLNANGDGFSFGVGGTSTGSYYDNTGTVFIARLSGSSKRWINTGVGISTANWHMGAMVFDGNGYPSLYFDGKLVYADAIGTAFNPSGGSVYIGHDNTNNASTRWFNGYIADAAIYNTALNATQIANLYQTTTSIIYGGSANFSSVTANTITGTIITGGTVNAPNYTSSLTEYQTIQSYAPIAFWQLNEASGNIIDYSGNGYTGTASNLGYGSPGPGVNSIGNSGFFAGSPSRVVANNPGTVNNKNVSLSVWFNAYGTAGGPLISIGNSGGAIGYGLGFGTTGYGAGNHLITNFNGTVSNVATAIAIATATWHHAVLTLNDSGNPSIYLDAGLIYSDATASNGGGTVIGVGYDINGPHYFNGYIADAAIFNTALNATQIANLYQTTSTIYGGSANFSSVTANTITGTGACPPGMVSPYAGSVAPNGWLLCQGQAVSRSTYPNLFAAIGTSYGTADGVTTFLLPNMTGRVSVGLDASGTVITSGNANILGKTNGEETHTLTTTEMPIHSHTGATYGSLTNMNFNGYITGGVGNSLSTNSVGAGTPQTMNLDVQAGPGGTVWAFSALRSGSGSGQGYTLNNTGNGVSAKLTITDGGHAHSIATDGSGAAHNNMQPYITLNYIIKT